MEKIRRSHGSAGKKSINNPKHRGERRGTRKIPWEITEIQEVIRDLSNEHDKANRILQRSKDIIQMMRFQGITQNAIIDNLRDRTEKPLTQQATRINRMTMDSQWSMNRRRVSASPQ